MKKLIMLICVAAAASAALTRAEASDDASRQTLALAALQGMAGDAISESPKAPAGIAVRAQAAGYSGCEYGTNGGVSCGGQYNGCEYGTNGGVSCGWQYSGCEYGTNGSVSCGGQYNGCEYGTNGGVSCGGSGQ